MEMLGDLEINRVYNMDCFEGMKMLPDESVDLIVTDPPYYIESLKENLKDQTLRQSSKNNIFHADWDSSFGSLDNFKEFIRDNLKEFMRVLKPKAQVYMFFSYHHIHWARIMIESLGFKFYKYLIWYKPDTMGVFPNQYGCNYEVMLWFRKQGDEGEVKLNIGNGQRDVFKHNSTHIVERKDAGFHPTPKPRLIIRQLIKNGSHEGDLVLDPFMGSGTTAVASKQTNRRFIGFELNPGYMDIIEKRLAQSTLFDGKLNIEGGKNDG